MMGDFSLSTDLLKDILKVAKPFGHNEKTRESEPRGSALCIMG